ncbi:MAG: putative metalloprotease CJM1_0395 family protein [Planctomycetota bacterium]
MPQSQSIERPQQQDRVELSPEARDQVRELKQRDRQVRAHEQAHKAAAGSHAGPISYTYETGPDGVRYAVDGEVPIDASPVEGDPQATVRKMQQVRRAALAPGEPSEADRRIAAKSRQQERKAQTELSGSSIDLYA